MATTSQAPLRERQSPEARVYAYIKEPLIGSSIKRTLVQLNGFKNVSTTIGMSQAGSANITFPNFKGALMRYVDISTILHTETAGQGMETTNSASWDFINKITNPSPSNIFASLWNDAIVSDASQDQAGFSGTPANSNFLQNSRSRGDLMAAGDTIKLVNKGLVYALPFLNMFDPIFVDYRGQDGKWYAGFTGLITRISESYARTSDQSISIQCKDLTTLLDNVSLVSGWNMLSVAESHSSLRDFVYSSEGNLAATSQSAYSNIFAAFDKVEDIILAVVKRSQDMWRFESAQGKIPGEVGVRAFLFDTSQVYDYKGISNLRGSFYMVDDDIDNMVPENFYNATNENRLRIESYLYNPKTVVGTKKILIDPLIRNFDNVFIHKLLNRDFSLFKDSLKSADQILNEIAAKMFAYKYFDGNGNLVFELAKPNALPNLTLYAGRSSSSVLQHNVSAKDPEGVTAKKYAYIYFDCATSVPVYMAAQQYNNSIDPVGTVTPDDILQLNNYVVGVSLNTDIFTTAKDGTIMVNANTPFIVAKVPSDQAQATYDVLNNSVMPIGTINIDPASVDTQSIVDTKTYLNYIKYTTLNFHGQNYMMSPDDYISFNWAIDESALTTVVATESNFAYNESIPDSLRKGTTSMHGVAVADYDHLAKLGVRRYQTQSLYNVTWPDDNAGARVLSYQSAAILERVNCMADSGSFTMNQRPELQLGRTFVNPLRMKAYLITGITNSWASGGPHTTVLNVTYGHPLHKTLEVPWLAIFMEPTVFFKNGEDSNIFNYVTKINADGFGTTGKNSAQEQLTIPSGTSASKYSDTSMS